LTLTERPEKTLYRCRLPWRVRRWKKKSVWEKSENINWQALAWIQQTTTCRCRARWQFWRW